MRRDIDSVEITHPDLGTKRVTPSAAKAFRRVGWVVVGEPEPIAATIPVSIVVPPAPAKNAKTDDWKAYATQVGVPIPDGAHKADVIEAVTAATTNRPTASAVDETPTGDHHNPEEG